MKKHIYLLVILSSALLSTVTYADARTDAIKYFGKKIAGKIIKKKVEHEYRKYQSSPQVSNICYATTGTCYMPFSTNIGAGCSCVNNYGIVEYGNIK